MVALKNEIETNFNKVFEVSLTQPQKMASRNIFKDQLEKNLHWDPFLDSLYNTYLEEVSIDADDYVKSIKTF